jgi:parvulin-like peptidyl-prolyl isomerase
MRIGDFRRLGGRRWRRLAQVIGMLGVALLAYGWGRYAALSRVTAAPPAGEEASSDYSQRVVAYIYKNVPITREDLGEYFISREGAAKLNLLVNKRIIEYYSQQRGIEVTAAEVNADIEQTIGQMKIDRKDFVEKVLRQYNKTLFEWKEDVVKPRLLLSKLCRDQVHATDEDFQHAFEAYYGEKIECRIILWPHTMKNHVMNDIYAKIRDSEVEFNRAACAQPSSKLASSGGKIDPIGRRTTGNEELEKEAFNLQPGEISRVIETKEGLLVIKCDKRIPADPKIKLSDVKAKLEKEILEKKLQVVIAQKFEELRKEADPKIFLKEYTTEEELMRDTHDLLKETQSSIGSPKTTPPTGN